MSLNKLVFATGNAHKVAEANDLINELKEIRIISLKEVNIHEDIPETGETLEENARQKAWYIKKKYGWDCFSEDTGLEIESLNGKPGIYSARYAGPSRSSEANINLVLKNLQGKKNRKARFRTIICLIIGSQEYLFEGIVNGTILENQQGDSGFGYDPIFSPDGFNVTFAQMTNAEKTSISHRGKAVKKLIAFLEASYQ